MGADPGAEDWRHRPRKKRSLIWKMPAGELAQLVSRSESLSDILRHFGLENKGGNHRTLKARLAADGIELSHIDLRPEAIMVKRRKAARLPLESALVEGSTYNRGILKRRLLASGMLKKECAECGQGAEWRGKPLVMVLDHINGIPDDNRLTNLRLLCPNCNSQTDTFCARNNSTKRSPIRG